jgi:hypothetical protein
VHGRNFVTHRIENAPNVDVKNAPILSFGSLLERAFPFNAGIVKRNVETAEFVDREIDHCFDVGIFRDVRADERRIAAEFFNFGNDLRAFFVAAPSQNDLRAGAHAFDRCGLADTGSSSGYERNFAENVLLFIVSFRFCFGKIVVRNLIAEKSFASLSQ